MANQGRDNLRPLCPTHYEAMVISPMAPNQPAMAKAEDAGEIHDCECLVGGCPQHYSPGYGYFTVAQNDDHWVATGSSSLRIRRRFVQVLCGKHQHSMFLESFDREAQVENFRCPERDCQRTMTILAGGPPVYWLDEGFFKKS
jgi:hypothetical protein